MGDETIGLRDSLGAAGAEPALSCLARCPAMLDDFAGSVPRADAVSITGSVLGAAVAGRVKLRNQPRGGSPGTRKCGQRSPADWRRLVRHGRTRCDARTAGPVSANR